MKALLRQARLQGHWNSRRAMQLALRRPDGTQVSLPAAGCALHLGRQDLGACPEAFFVSRKQCVIEVTSAADGSSPQAVLRHIGAGNPTKVVRGSEAAAHPQGQPGASQELVLAADQSCVLRPGDSIALVANCPQRALTVVVAGQAAEPAGTAGQAGREQRNTAAGAPDHPPPAAAGAAAVAGHAAAPTPGTTAAEQVDRVSTAGTSAAAAVPVAARAAASAAPSPSAGGGSGAVMLLLVGMPGSGKSTFSAALAQRSALAWARVNQDSIRGGKKGTRQQCLAAAKGALTAGKCCIIDRCNYNSEQRQDFLQLAGQLGVPAHAVVLQLPRELCIRRAAARQNHEGGVTAAEAPAVVSRMAAMLSKAGPPTRAEGLRSIMVCTSDDDVSRALQAWGGYAGGGAAAAAEAGAGASSGQGHAAGASGSGSADADMAPWRIFSQRHLSGAAQQAGLAAAGQRASAAAAAGHASAAAQTSIPMEIERPAKRQALDTPTAQHGQCADAPANTDGAAPSSSAHDEGRQQEDAAATAGPATRTSPKPGPPVNAFALMAAAARSTSAHAASTAARHHSTSSHAPTSEARPPGTALERAARAMRAKLGAPWAQPLAQMAQHPDKLLASEPSAHVDEQVVLLPDKYPKARHHVLLVARDPGLASVYDLRAQHAPLLRHMLHVAQRWVRDTVAAAPDSSSPQAAEGAGHPAGPVHQQARLTEDDFVMGFHSVPSMRQLHMHVLSRDMDSPALKNKKHWNSFTTGFFLPAGRVLQQLERSGGLEAADLEAAEALLKADMRCHRCGLVLKSVPLIKKHLKSCTAAGYTSWQE